MLPNHYVFNVFVYLCVPAKALSDHLCRLRLVCHDLRIHLHACRIMDDQKPSFDFQLLESFSVNKYRATVCISLIKTDF